MKVEFKLFASLSRYLPAGARSTSRLELDLAPGTTVLEVLEARGLPLELCALVLVNGVFVPPEARAGTPLSEGDVLAVWPPVAGG